MKQRDDERAICARRGHQPGYGYFDFNARTTAFRCKWCGDEYSEVQGEAAAPALNIEWKGDWHVDR